MKVYIGKYRKWIGPHQIADWLSIFRVSEEKRHKIGEWLAHRNGKDTYLFRFCNWIDSKKKRKIKIKIHPYDVWNADKTLGMIILPVMKEYKIQKENHGVFMVSDEDVPENLRSNGATDEYGYEPYDSLKKKNDYVIDEIIWAFEEILDEESTFQFFHYPEEGEKYDFVETGEEYDGEKLYEFKSNLSHFDRDGFKSHEERISNGLMLFGKYYRGFWT